MYIQYFDPWWVGELLSNDLESRVIQKLGITEKKIYWFSSWSFKNAMLINVRWQKWQSHLWPFLLQWLASRLSILGMKCGQRSPSDSSLDVALLTLTCLLLRGIFVSVSSQGGFLKECKSSLIRPALFLKDTKCRQEFCVYQGYFMAANLSALWKCLCFPCVCSCF